MSSRLVSYVFSDYSVTYIFFIFIVKMDTASGINLDLDIADEQMLEIPEAVEKELLRDEDHNEGNETTMELDSNVTMKSLELDAKNDLPEYESNDESDKSKCRKVCGTRMDVRDRKSLSYFIPTRTGVHRSSVSTASTRDSTSCAGHPRDRHRTSTGAGSSTGTRRSCESGTRIGSRVYRLTEIYRTTDEDGRTIPICMNCLRAGHIARHCRDRNVSRNISCSRNSRDSDCRHCDYSN